MLEGQDGHDNAVEHEPEAAQKRQAGARTVDVIAEATGVTDAQPILSLIEAGEADLQAHPRISQKDSRADLSAHLRELAVIAIHTLVRLHRILFSIR